MKTAHRVRVALATLLLLFVAMSALQSNVSATAGNKQEETFRPGTVLVEFKKGVAAATVAPALQNIEAETVGTVYGSDVKILRVSRGRELAISQALRQNPNVRYAEPDYRYQAFATPSDPKFGDQWAHATIRSTAAWDVTPGTADVTIAIIDSGVDESHPELVDKLVPGHSFLGAKEDDTPHDLNGHGTHVAGIAAAEANNGEGIAGMAWGAKIMPLRVLDRTGSGYTSDIAAGINWARNNGAEIINLSLGGPDSSTALKEAVDAAHAAGVLVVAAMGNEGNKTNPVNYPAAYDHVLAVAATDRYDRRAGYSNYGDHVDVAAPGGVMSRYHDSNGIYSTMPTYDDVYLTQERDYNTHYDYLQGTSQAAPLVSGLAALIWSMAPDLSPDEVQQIIQDTAVDLGASGWDAEYGHGRIDAEAALAFAALDAPDLDPIDNSDADGTYQIAWSEVAFAAGYRLQEDDNANFSSPEVVYEGEDRQYAARNQPTGRWYYRVQAYNNSDESDWSNIESTVVLPTTPTLQAISNSGETDAYVLDWNTVEGAEGYRLQQSTDGTFTNSELRYVGPGTSYNVTGQPSGQWYYRVQAYSALGDSDWSAVQSTNVETLDVPAPVFQAIHKAVKDRDYTIQWSTVVTASSYTLERAPSTYFAAPSVVYTGPLTQVNVINAPSGMSYYRVRAHTDEGSSPWSAPQSVFVEHNLWLPLVMNDYPPAPPLSNGDFEMGATDWTEFSSGNYQIIFNNDDINELIEMEFLPEDFPVRAQSGEYFSWLGGADSELAYLEQRITIHTDSPYLTYWYWLASPETNCEDQAMISIDGTAVQSYDLCVSANTDGWVEDTVDLSSYAGESVTLRFQVTTDSIDDDGDPLHASNFFLDNVSFEASAAATSAPVGGTSGGDPAAAKP